MNTCSDVEVPDEIWEDVAGFEGRYQISHTGKVRRVRKDSVLVLKAEPHFGGKVTPLVYRYYLTLNGKTFKVTDKFLMALTFVGPRPSNKHVARLIDDNKPLSPTNVIWRHKRYSTMDEKMFCPNGHFLSAENYYPTVYARTGHKRCKICHREQVTAYEKRQRNQKKKETIPI